MPLTPTAPNKKSLRAGPFAVIALVVLIIAWVTVSEVGALASPTGVATLASKAAIALALAVGLVAAMTINRSWRGKMQRDELIRKAEDAKLAAAISSSLAEGGLDAEAAATEIAGHLVTSIGDACVISLFADDGATLVPVVVRAADPRVERAIRLAFPAIVVSIDDPYLTGKAVSTSTAQQSHGSTKVVAASSRAALVELFNRHSDPEPPCRSHALPAGHPYSPPRTGGGRPLHDAVLARGVRHGRGCFTAGRSRPLRPHPG